MHSLQLAILHNILFKLRQGITNNVTTSYVYAYEYILSFYDLDGFC